MAVLLASSLCTHFAVSEASGQPPSTVHLDVRATVINSPPVILSVGWPANINCNEVTRIRFVVRDNNTIADIRAVSLSWTSGGDWCNASVRCVNVSSGGVLWTSLGVVLYEAAIPPHMPDSEAATIDIRVWDEDTSASEQALVPVHVGASSKSPSGSAPTLPEGSVDVTVISMFVVVLFVVIVWRGASSALDGDAAAALDAAMSIVVVVCIIVMLIALMQVI